MASMQVEGRIIEISKPDKVLFPDDDITKWDLADYYRRIAGRMIPYLEGRPLSMYRFPDGIAAEGFFQKDVPDHFPDWIERFTVEKRTGGHITHAICNNGGTLVYLADQACIVPHVWLSRVDNIERPDRMIFDLDPPGEDFSLVRYAASRIKGILDDLELVCFVMTTGSRGLHVVVPLEAREGYDDVRSFAGDVAHILVKRYPESMTTEQRKEKRSGRLFLDTLRNGYAQTAVPPYAVRAKAGAPVATPLDWDEVNRSDLHPRRYTLASIFRRLGKKEDPWALAAHTAQSLGQVRARLNEMLGS